METKHTKGEWATLKSYDGIRIIKKGNEGYSDSIAKLEHYEHEQEANAKLIASSPLLLEACVKSLNYSIHYEDRKFIENAIKKATT